MQRFSFILDLGNFLALVLTLLTTRLVLDQHSDNGPEPLAFFSRALSQSQRRYSVYDRELTAIHKAVRHFGHQLEGRSFLILTDHKPLIFAFSQSLDKASPRQQRYLDFV